MKWYDAAQSTAQEVFNATLANQEARKPPATKDLHKNVSIFSTITTIPKLCRLCPADREKSRRDRKNPSFGSRILDFQVFDAFRD